MLYLGKDPEIAIISQRFEKAIQQVPVYVATVYQIVKELNGKLYTLKLEVAITDLITERSTIEQVTKMGRLGILEDNMALMEANKLA